MKEKNYEKKALLSGFYINLFCSLAGITFFFITNSMAIFMDAITSLILTISTLISIKISSKSYEEPNEKYPLGRYPIENVFVLFRSLMILSILVFMTISSIRTIIYFYLGEVIIVNIEFLQTIIYAIVMSGACFLIFIVYRYYNKKLNNKSKVIKVEIVASLFDGLVTIVSCTSLLCFSYIPFLQPISLIGDSITVLVLALLYFKEPYVILIEQINILTDRRLHPDQEKVLKHKLIKKFANITIYDLYICEYGVTSNIYLTFTLKNKKEYEYIEMITNQISEEIYLLYPQSQVFLYQTNKKLHLL